ncbi:hypothetical protein BC629DRAFT_1542188, partial [Irpex lacteus]
FEDASSLLSGSRLTSLDLLSLLDLIVALLAFDLAEQDLRLALHLRHEADLLRLLSVVCGRAGTYQKRHQQ